MKLYKKNNIITDELGDIWEYRPDTPTTMATYNKKYSSIGFLESDIIVIEGNYKMNKTERIKMLRAMDYIARHSINEHSKDAWFIWGTEESEHLDTMTDEELEYKIEEDFNFASIMDGFLYSMKLAKESDGLKCDDIISYEN